MLKKGGKICLAQPCFDMETKNLPDIFRQTNGWNAEYEKYHSPDWWESFFEASGNFEVEFCEEIRDGIVMWEDHVLYCEERSNWSEEYLEKTAWLIRQLIWGKVNSPALTHFILSATKKMNSYERRKDGIRIIDSRQFDQNPNKFELRVNDVNALLCRFGNRRKLIGFDKQSNEYIRFTKSVLKKLISLFEEKNVT